MWRRSSVLLGLKGEANQRRGIASGTGIPMSVILVFVAFVLVGDSIAVSIASIVERFSEPTSLLVFFALFVAVFWIGWRAAVYVTERYILSQN